MEDQLTRLPRVSGDAQVYLSPALNKVLDEAFKQAGQMKDEYVSTEHIFYGLAADKTSDTGELLAEVGITRKPFSRPWLTRGSTRVTDQTPEDKFQALEKYGIDLTGWPGRASSIRSSAATRKSAASCRSSRAARRTTPC